MNDFECPYCGKDLCEPGDCREMERNYEWECGYCGKVFQFSVDYTINFYTKKADCLNGDPHDYRKIVGAPDWWFKDKRRCSMCGDQIELAPPVFPDRSGSALLGEDGNA